MFVFVSYAQADKPLVASLVNKLRLSGITVWWDDNLEASEDFHDVIVDALSRARAAIVIWSSHSIKSRFVRDEARRHHRHPAEAERRWRAEEYPD
jgi:hypothetical protein